MNEQPLVVTPNPIDAIFVSVDVFVFCKDNEYERMHPLLRITSYTS